MLINNQQKGKMCSQEGLFDIPLPPSREHGIFDIIAPTLWTIIPCRSPLFPSTEHDAHHDFASGSGHLVPGVEVPCIKTYAIGAIGKAIVVPQQTFMAGIVFFEK